MIRVDILHNTPETGTLKSDVAFFVLPRIGERIELEGYTYMVKQILHVPADNSSRNIELYVELEEFR